MSDQRQGSIASEMRKKIVIERTYRERVSELWDLWTTKEGFESWWGPEGFRAEVHHIEARLGGELHYSMIADAPEQIEAIKRMGQPISRETHGSFTEFRPHERVAITHRIDFLTGVPVHESTMTVDFFPQGERVRSASPSGDLRDMQSDGCTNLHASV